jgi:hypothetical protein
VKRIGDAVETYEVAPECAVVVTAAVASVVDEDEDEVGTEEVVLEELVLVDEPEL